MLCKFKSARKLAIYNKNLKQKIKSTKSYFAIKNKSLNKNALGLRYCAFCIVSIVQFLCIEQMKRYRPKVFKKKTLIKITFGMCKTNVCLATLLCMCVRVCVFFFLC